MKVGTNCFESRKAADRYYRAYGMTPADVDCKITLGEIRIGADHLQIREGDALTVDRDGRYWLTSA